MRYIKTYESGFNLFRRKKDKEPEPVNVNKTEDEVKSEVEKVLVDRLINRYSPITDNIEFYHHYLESIFETHTISYRFNMKSDIDTIEPETKVILRIAYKKDTSKGIIIDRISIQINSELKCDFNEPHQELEIKIPYGNAGKFVVRKGWRSFYAESDFNKSLYMTNINDSGYTISSFINESTKKHFELINHYIGIDEHNLNINKRFEEIKDELDHIRQCLADVEDISKETIIKLGDKKVVDGRIVSKEAIIACSFDIESLKTSTVNGGININFDQKTIQLFDYLTEAKNRISDIFDNVTFDMDISNGKIIFFINVAL